MEEFLSQIPHSGYLVTALSLPLLTIERHWLFYSLPLKCRASQPCLSCISRLNPYLHQRTHRLHQDQNAVETTPPGHWR